MTFTGKTLVGILVAEITVFAWGPLFWGATLIPYSVWKSTANDAETQAALRELRTESGTYYSGF